MLVQRVGRRVDEKRNNKYLKFLVQGSKEQEQGRVDMRNVKKGDEERSAKDAGKGEVFRAPEANPPISGENAHSG